MHRIGQVCLSKVGFIRRVGLSIVLARFDYPRCGSSGEWTCAPYWQVLPIQGGGSSKEWTCALYWPGLTTKGWGSFRERTYAPYWPGLPIQGGVHPESGLSIVLARFDYARCGSSGEWTCPSYWPGLPIQGGSYPECGLVYRIGHVCLPKV